MDLEARAGAVRQAAVHPKFPTMRVDAEEDRRRGGLDPSPLPFKLDGEGARIPRPGRRLRRTSRDELPQLGSLLKGDRGLVGPRPLPIERIRADADPLAAPHQARAGLTGRWQVQWRADLDLEEAPRMDGFHIENGSARLGLRILVRTARTVLRGRGAC